ncbi:uncharacterized protein [Macrobrachium rosenbergii]|uniref:uncharacterized protein isoform X2 n=1 Tax=Macrobrachium rosenbergii TaxID=79674 RepID=UPI0034D6CB78
MKQIPTSYLIIILAVKTMVVSMNEVMPHGRSFHVPVVSSEAVPPYKSSLVVPGVSSKGDPPRESGVSIPGVSSNDGPSYAIGVAIPEVSTNERPPHGNSAVIPSETFSQGRSLLIPLVEGVTYEKTVKTGFLLLFGTLAFTVWVNRRRPNILKGSRYVKDASRLDVLCSPYSTFGRINCNLRGERPKHRRPLELSYRRGTRTRSPRVP